MTQFNLQSARNGDVRYKQILDMLPESKEIPGLLETISNLGHNRVWK